MDSKRARHAGGLLVGLLIVGCTAATPSLAPAPANVAPSAASLAPATAGPAPSIAAIAPTASPPARPSGTLLVWQLDGTDGATAKTESVFRLDLANGATSPVSTIPVNEMTCCPGTIRIAPGGGVRKAGSGARRRTVVPRGKRR